VTEEELLVTYERSWNAHDAAACASCFAPDGVRELRLLLPCRSLGHRDPVVCGRDDIREDIRRVLSAVPDLRVEVLGAAYSSDRRLWTEWRAEGTLADDLNSRRAGGRPIDVVGVSVFRLSNDGFLEERLYWDSALVLGRAADAAPG
jgi:SnoaL-like domain